MAWIEQQVNGLPLVGDGGVANHLVLTDVGLRDSAGQSVKGEVWPDLPHWEGVKALVQQQGHTVQIAKML